MKTTLIILLILNGSFAILNSWATYDRIATKDPVWKAIIQGIGALVGWIAVVILGFGLSHI